MVYYNHCIKNATSFVNEICSYNPSETGNENMAILTNR